ncbi:MAG: DUF177 domain-containing protein [Gammaproteobacteria bacterium]|nr:DUF177 domain-containing protein [Gammaproteobacteria bacterium]
MLSLLPDFADPRRLCALGKAYEGRLPLAQMPRLAPLLTSTEGEAAFALAFATDDEKRAIVTVHVNAEIHVQCQRCLGSMVWPVDSGTVLAVVSGPDEAERLPDNLDPLLVEDERVALRTLVEDELLLAVPTAPTHAVDECAVKLDDVNAAEATGDSAGHQRDDNPFAALADWKSDGQQQD